MQIAGRQIGGDHCFVISELGNNHGGDLVTAMRLIDAAVDAGADAVKLQCRDNKNLYTRAFYDSPYNSEHAYGPTYGAHREALELHPIQLGALRDYAAEKNIVLFATAFDERSVDLCFNLEFPAIKIASGSLTNTPLIAYAAQTRLPLIISTGGGTWDDIQRAYEATAGYEDPIFLQCTASYPCAYDELDLKVILELKGYNRKRLVGVSLHDNGIAMAIAAYTLGARVIEKHVTLNRTMKGTDHPFSLEPQGFKKMVRDLRRVEVALGSEKRQHPSEIGPLRKMQSVLVCNRDHLPAGHILERGDVAAKSPATEGALEPYWLETILGRRLEQALNMDDLIPRSLITDAEDRAV